MRGLAIPKLDADGVEEGEAGRSKATLGRKVEIVAQ